MMSNQTGVIRFRPGDVVIARFPWETQGSDTKSIPRPCLVIQDFEHGTEVAYGTTSPDYVDVNNAQIIKTEPGEAGQYVPAAFILYRRRVLPKTPHFFPHGGRVIGRLSEDKCARVERVIEEIAAMEKWETGRVHDYRLVPAFALPGPRGVQKRG